MCFISALVEWRVFEKKDILWFQLAKNWVTNGDIWMFGFKDTVSFTKVHGQIVFSQALLFAIFTHSYEIFHSRCRVNDIFFKVKFFDKFLFSLSSH